MGMMKGTRWLPATAVLLVGWLAGVAGAATYFAVFGSPTAGRGVTADGGAMPVVFSVDTAQKLVALTFDDGPDPRYCRRILSILRRYDARATFFVEGRNVREHPDLARAEFDEGHELANHSMNHRDMTFASPGLARKEIAGASEIIERVCGQRPRYFRPPRGHVNLPTVRLANRLGHRVVLWSLGLERVKGFTLRQCADIVAENVRPGTIILAHDSSPTRWWVPEVLPRTIRGIQARGYRLVTLSELLAASGT